MLVTNLPALEPDIRFELLQFDKEAFEFCFSVKKEALGPHICVRWPWDECYQREIHWARMTEKPFFSISQNAVRVGTLSWLVHPDHVRFGEFYLFEKYQRQELGSRILTHVLTGADRMHLPVRLEFLKWNPVGKLYLRHGFRPTHESDIHIFLERPASSAP